jgi:N-acetylglucosamine-6-phosphate deacetylase
MHIHGAGGYDTMDGTFESINALSMILAQHGVTSFMPTTMTESPEKIRAALRAVKTAQANGTDGAAVMGVHLEGPFISPSAAGAQDIKCIKKPDADSFMDLIENDPSIVKRITIAPEIPGAIDLIKFAVGHGIIVSIGHSAGEYDDAMKGIAAGASHSTHLYNAMKGFSHRAPGVVGAVFDSRITTEVIADGIHVHFAAIRTALSIKGDEGCALISDSMRACCMEDGRYDLGGQEVTVKGGEARLQDGTLAGSTLSMDTAVKNMVRNTRLSIAGAVALATSVPARICRIDDSKGHIKPGYDADIIIFDSDISIKKVIISGRTIV